MVIKALFRTTAVMLLSAAVWSLIGLGYNRVQNREAFDFKWHPSSLGLLAMIGGDKLEAYEKTRELSLWTGLVTGLAVALIYRPAKKD